MKKKNCDWEREVRIQKIKNHIQSAKYREIYIKKNALWIDKWIKMERDKMGEKNVDGK